MDPRCRDRATLAERDHRDPLAALRDRVELPPGVVYLDGNSLGPPPRGVAARLARVAAEEWGRGLVGSWESHGWLDLPRRVAAKIAPLVGADTDEVAVADSTSVDLFKLLAAALELRPGRRVVLTTRDEFPTDLYVAEGLARLAGAELRVVATADLAGALDASVAVLLLGHVRYATGERLDMADWTRRAHDAGALALWDVAHSAGALRVDLGGRGVDLAVGCGYKFLNGGPGAPAWLFVARRHQAAARSPIQGWLGSAAPFAFAPDYVPAAGVDRFLCGTPPILSLAALDAALDAFAGVDPTALDDRARELGDLLVALVAARCPGLELASPRDPARRGAQVSFRHPRAQDLVASLAARGVVADYRPPDLLRCGLAPLFLRRVELWDATEALAASAAAP